MPAAIRLATSSSAASTSGSRRVTPSHGREASPSAGFRHGVGTALQFGLVAIGANGRVVRYRESGQIVQDVTGEPTKGVRPTHQTHVQRRHTTAERFLDPRSHCQEPVAERAGMLDGHVPVFGDERFERPRSCGFGQPFGKGRKEWLLVDRPRFVGNIGGAGIERDCFQPDERRIGIPDRHFDRCRFHFVGIDDEIERRAVEPLSESRRREGFEPDAGMAEVRLVAGENQWPCRIAQFLPRFPAELRKERAVDADVGRVEELPIARNEIGDAVESRFRQQFAVALGSAESAKGRHDHGRIKSTRNSFPIRKANRRRQTRDRPRRSRCDNARAGPWDR